MLTEIELQRCGLTTETIKPLCTLLALKYKLRSMNLSNNGVTDEGARELLSAIKENPFLIKFKMELNPTR